MLDLGSYREHLTPEQALARGYHFDPTLGRWLDAQGRPAFGLANAGRDPNSLTVPHDTLKEAAVKGALVAGGAFAIPAIAGAVGGGAAPAAASGGGSTAAGTTAGTAAATSVGGKIISGIKKGATAIGDVSNVAGNIAAGRAQGRALEAGQQQSAARDEQSVYKDAQRQALLAALLGGVKDTTVTPPPGVNMGTVEGGLKPSALQGKDELSTILAAQARKRLENPPDTNYDALGGTPSGFDKVLSAIGQGGSLLGTAAPFLPSAPQLPDAPNVSPLSVADLVGQRRPGGLMAGVNFAPPTLGVPPPSLLTDPRYRVPRSGVRFQ